MFGQRSFCPFGLRRFPVLRGCSNVSCQFLYIDKREGSERGKDKDVTDECKFGILKLVGHDLFQFVLCQILTLLHVTGQMELGKWIAGDMPVLVCPHYHTLHPYNRSPDGAVVQIKVIGEIHGKVLDEIRCQFFDERSD